MKIGMAIYVHEMSKVNSTGHARITKNAARTEPALGKASAGRFPPYSNVVKRNWFCPLV